jgi:hypothetical protein
MEATASFAKQMTVALAWRTFRYSYSMFIDLVHRLCLNYRFESLDSSQSYQTHQRIYDKILIPFATSVHPLTKPQSLLFPVRMLLTLEPPPPTLAIAASGGT